MLGDATGPRNHEETTYGFYRGHLQGQLDLSIYPLRENGTCSWAMASVKTEDADPVLNFVRLLRGHEIDPIVVRMQPRYQIFVFVQGSVPASAIRSVFGGLANEAGVGKVVKIVPSCDHPKPPRYGDHVLLPYVGAIPMSSENGRRPKHSSLPGYRVAIDLDGQRDLSLEEFLDLAEYNRIPCANIVAVADRLVDVAQRSTVPRNGRGPGAGTITRKRSGPKRSMAMADPFLEVAHRILVEAKAPLRALQVLTELRRTADQNGVSRRRRETIAADLRCSRATVFRAEKRLREIGLIEPIEDRRDVGRWPRVNYRLLIPGGRQSPIDMNCSVDRSDVSIANFPRCEKSANGGSHEHIEKLPAQQPAPRATGQEQRHANDAHCPAPRGAGRCGDREESHE